MVLLRKLDPSFSTDADLTPRDGNNLENVISQFFSDASNSLKKIITERDSSQKIRKDINTVNKEKEDDIPQKNPYRQRPQETKSLDQPREESNYNRPASSQPKEPSGEEKALQTPKTLGINSPNIIIPPSQSPIQPPIITPSSQLQLSNNYSSIDNTELLKEINMLRRKMVDYESVQEELQYYKNLSRTYHNKNQDNLNSSQRQVYGNQENTFRGTGGYSNELTSSSRFRTSYGSSFGKQHNVCDMSSYNRNYI